MGTAQCNRKELKHRNPTRTQLRLLNCIDKAGKNGLCLSKRELADRLSCSIKTIDRGIAQLRTLGLIEVEPCHLSNGQQVANMYRACENARKDIDLYCFVLRIWQKSR